MVSGSHFFNAAILKCSTVFYLTAEGYSCNHALWVCKRPKSAGLDHASITVTNLNGHLCTHCIFYKRSNCLGHCTWICAVLRNPLEKCSKHRTYPSAVSNTVRSLLKLQNPVRLWHLVEDIFQKTLPKNSERIVNLMGKSIDTWRKEMFGRVHPGKEIFNCCVKSE